MLRPQPEVAYSFIKNDSHIMMNSSVPKKIHVNRIRIFFSLFHFFHFALTSSKLFPVKKGASVSKIRKYIPAGRNKCPPHVQMSGTHNVQHYLDHFGNSVGGKMSIP